MSGHCEWEMEKGCLSCHQVVNTRGLLKCFLTTNIIYIKMDSPNTLLQEWKCFILEGAKLQRNIPFDFQHHYCWINVNPANTSLNNWGLDREGGIKLKSFSGREKYSFRSSLFLQRSAELTHWPTNDRKALRSLTILWAGNVICLFGKIPLEKNHWNVPLGLLR